MCGYRYIYTCMNGSTNILTYLKSNKQFVCIFQRQPLISILRDLLETSNILGYVKLGHFPSVEVLMYINTPM